MDVTNPGLVNVANQTYGNPDPNSGTALLTPEELDVLIAAGNQGYPPAGNGVGSSVFPTPAEVVVTGANQVGNVGNVPTPAATEVNLDTVVIGQGSWQDTLVPLQIYKVNIVVIQAFVASVALDTNTTIGVRRQGQPNEFEFGQDIPLTLNVVGTVVNVPCAGGILNSVVRLRSAGGPVTFADLTAGAFVVSVEFNNGTFSSFSVPLVQLQSFGAVSDTEFNLGALPAAATLNLGKKFVPPSDFIVVGPAESFQTNVTESTTVTRTVTAVYDADSLYNAPTATTTRFMLVVGTPNFTSYPVSVLGRQITFADDTITVANQGANRIITGFSTNYVVIDRNDPTEDDGNVASMAVPQVGDTFIVDIQRTGSEQVNTESLPSTDVFIFPPPPTFVPNSPQALQYLGEVDISTGPQPGTPIITSGTAAPTAVNVYVADQSTSVGLPVNVNI